MLNAINTITGRVSGPRAAAPPLATTASTTAPPTHPDPGGPGPLLSIQFNCFAFLRKCPAITARPVCQPLVYLFVCLWVRQCKYLSLPPIHIPAHSIPPHTIPPSNRTLNCCLFVTHPHCDFLATTK